LDATGKKTPFHPAITNQLKTERRTAWLPYSGLRHELMRVSYGDSRNFWFGEEAMANIQYLGELGSSSGTDQVGLDALEVINGATGRTLTFSSNNGADIQSGQISLLTGQVTFMNDAAAQTGSVPLASEAANTPYLFSVHSVSGELQVAAVASDGSIGAFNTVSGTAGLGIKTVELIEGGPTPTIVASCYDGQMVGTFTIDETNTLVGVNTPIAPDVFGGYRVTDLSVHASGEETRFVAISAQANMIASFEIDGNGNVTELDHRGAADGLGINSPTSLSQLTVNGRDYVLVSSYGTSSLTVLELAEDGALTLTDQINDNTTTRFGNVLEVETLAIGDHAFVALAGSDGGVTLLQMLNGGMLSEVATYENPGSDSFGDITMLELFAEGDTLVILTGSDASDMVSAFSFDTSNMGSVIDGRGAGTAIDDTLLSNESTALLTGGDGNDTFILRDTGTTVEITDYEHGVDQIDLSHWPRAYSLTALEFVPLADGIQISYLDNTLVIRSHDGNPLEQSDFTNEDFFGLWRIPVDEQVGTNAAPNASNGMLLNQGSNSADSMNGTDGADLLLGHGANDALFGFDGDDLIFGGTGEDTLSGGQGQDTFVFDAADADIDMVTDYEGASVDTLSGRFFGDAIFVQNMVSFDMQILGTDVHLAGDVIQNATSGNLLIAYLNGTSDITSWSRAALSGIGTAASTLVATLFDLDGDEAFAQIGISFDTAGNTTRLTALNDDGSQTITSFDVSEDESWGRQVEELDDQGQPTQLDQFLDNGGTVEASYDPENTRGWDSFTRHFDESSSLSEQMVVYDDATSRRLINDTEDANVWQQIIEDRNSNGALDDKRVLYDNGNELRTILDVDEANTWHSVEEFRDAGGALYDKRFNYDDGTSQRLLFDTDSTEVWDNIVEFRDDTGALYDKRTNYDNGTQLRLILDPNDTASWETIRELSNAEGNMYDKLTTGDTGASTRVILDTESIASWDMIVESRNEDGDMFRKTTTYDNTNYQLLLFDVDDLESWDVHTRVFDSNDVLISESFE
jgi:hypothetical protein